MLYFSLKVNTLHVYYKAINNFNLSTFSVGKWSTSIRFYKNFMRLLGWYFLLIPISCYCRDFGVVGDIFPVSEVHFGRDMSRRANPLTPEQQKKIQQEMQKKARETIERPKGYKLPRATEYKKRTYDSSTRISYDIKDHTGRVIYPKGFRADPFNNPYGVSVSLTRDWLFFDGDDPAQVMWASKLSGGLILISGSPVEVSKTLDRYVYFDQAGEYRETLKLRVLPARLSQVDGQLIIEEFVL